MDDDYGSRDDRFHEGYVKGLRYAIIESWRNGRIVNIIGIALNFMPERTFDVVNNLEVILKFRKKQNTTLRTVYKCFSLYEQ